MRSCSPAHGWALVRAVRNPKIGAFTGEGDMDSMTGASKPSETKLIIPALRSFYDWAADFSWLIIRLTAGLMLLPHGIPKVFDQGRRPLLRVVPGAR